MAFFFFTTPGGIDSRRDIVLGVGRPNLQRHLVKRKATNSHKIMERINWVLCACIKWLKWTESSWWHSQQLGANSRHASLKLICSWHTDLIVAEPMLTRVISNRIFILHFVNFWKMSLITFWTDLSKLVSCKGAGGGRKGTTLSLVWKQTVWVLYFETD